MNLARAAATRALANQADPAPSQAAEPPAEPDALLFERLAATVRDCIALEASLSPPDAPTNDPETTSTILRAAKRNLSIH